MLLVLNLPLGECIDNTQREMKFREKEKGRRKKNKEAQLMTKNQGRAKKGHKPSKAQNPHRKQQESSP
jgi:hypothetical protein